MKSELIRTMDCGLWLARDARVILLLLRAGLCFFQPPHVTAETRRRMLQTTLSGSWQIRRHWRKVHFGLSKQNNAAAICAHAFVWLPRQCHGCLRHPASNGRQYHQRGGGDKPNKWWCRLTKNLGIAAAVKLLACSIIVLTMQGARADSLIIEGAGIWKTFLYGDLDEEHAVTFKLHMGNGDECGWLIEFCYKNEYVEKCISGTDGSNILTVAYYKPAYTNAIGGYAFVERAVIPRGDGFLPISAVWLAFIAPCYFEKVNANRISPPYFKDGRAENIGYYETVAFHVTKQSSDSRLISSIVFLHDGQAVNERHEWIEAPKPFNAGFTNAVFKANGYLENRGFGMVVREFTLDYFYPFADKNNKGQYRLYLAEACRLQVTNVWQTNVVSLFPPVPAQVNYADRRFMRSNTPDLRLSYRSDHYLSDMEVMQSLEFRKAQQQKMPHALVSRPKSAPRTWRKVLVWCLLVGSIPLAFCIYKSIATKQTN